MNRIVLDGNEIQKELNFNKDCSILISEDVETKEFKINILDCKVTIIDMSASINKKIVFNNSKGTVIEIVKGNSGKKLIIDNINSDVEYNLIDLVNNDIHYSINETSSDLAKTQINVASIGYKASKKNYTIYTENNTSNTQNVINCFGIVKDTSLLKYDVSSFIKKGAKKSVVKQSSSILLFDETSKGENNPVLLIEENDVKASHGSSIGKIDDDTMFYMCSRGLSKIEATNLICLGKIENLLNKIDDEKIKENLINGFKERMR